MFLLVLVEELPAAAAASTARSLLSALPGHVAALSAVEASASVSASASATRSPAVRALSAICQIVPSFRTWCGIEYLD